MPRERVALAEKILEMKDCVALELYSGYEKTLPHRGFAELDTVLGCTVNPALTKDGVRIFIAYEQLQPLVRDDLTDVER